MNALSLSFTIYNILNNRESDKILSKKKISARRKRILKNTYLKGLTLLFFGVNVNTIEDGVKEGGKKAPPYQFFSFKNFLLLAPKTF